ncbi:MAG: carbohydrate ABC transporter permease [Anaerolineae bacterium]|nr:carbohydrate ABC transporter permease [Anaerolineae bacterium]
MSTTYTTSQPAGGTRTSKLLRRIGYHLLLLTTCFVMIYPILWMLASSFKEEQEIWANMASLIPTAPTLHNYVDGWRGFSSSLTFTTFYLNSFIYAGVGTLARVASSALVAYAFSRIRFWGRDFWFGIMMLTMMLPFQIVLIPQYILFNQLGWVNTFLPLLVPRFFGEAFFIFMAVQFMRGIPQELTDAAEIDGCNRIGTFTRIMLPLVRPVLITSGIFSFYWLWDDFFTPLIYLSDPKLYTVSLAIRAFADGSSDTNWGAIFAMSTLSLVPVIVIFFAFQRYLVEGIATTGLKG